MLPDSENALKLICALVIALTGALWFMSFRFRQLKRVENANQNRGPKSAPKKTKKTICQTNRGRPTRANKPNGYVLGSYRLATAPELHSRRLPSVKSVLFDSPATNLGPSPT